MSEASIEEPTRRLFLVLVLVPLPIATPPKLIHVGQPVM